jgi:hypothetical protein
MRGVQLQGVPLLTRCRGAPCPHKPRCAEPRHGSAQHLVSAAATSVSRRRLAGAAPRWGRPRKPAAHGQVVAASEARRRRVRASRRSAVSRARTFVMMACRFCGEAANATVSSTGMVTYTLNLNICGQRSESRMVHAQARPARTSNGPFPMLAGGRGCAAFSRRATACRDARTRSLRLARCSPLHVQLTERSRVQNASARERHNGHAGASQTAARPHDGPQEAPPATLPPSKPRDARCVSGVRACACGASEDPGRFRPPREAKARPHGYQG